MCTGNQDSDCEKYFLNNADWEKVLGGIQLEMGGGIVKMNKTHFRSLIYSLWGIKPVPECRYNSCWPHLVAGSVPFPFANNKDKAKESVVIKQE